MEENIIKNFDEIYRDVCNHNPEMPASGKQSDFITSLYIQTIRIAINNIVAHLNKKEKNAEKS